jgi:hypothetical protein
MTPELELERRKVGREFQHVYEQLLREDREATPIGKPKEIGGQKVGIWGQQISGDPLINPAKTLEDMFPQTAAAAIRKAIPSDMVAQAKQELRLLNDPGWVAKTFDDPSEAKTRRRELLQFIEDFRAYPHDALAKLQNTYQEQHVNTYWDVYEKKRTAIDALQRARRISHTRSCAPGRTSRTSR